MKRVTLGELLGQAKSREYGEQYTEIMALIDQGKLWPVKASGINGKKPALYREYWIAEPQKDYSEIEEELKYSLVPLISVDYYLAHPETYEEEREYVLALNRYLRNERELLEKSESVNERSFEIWGKEKFLSRGQGRKVLKHCGIGEEMLNMYGTAEPFAYYACTREVPQNILILENKDTFYSMRRALLGGKTDICGMKTGTLIYGAGKRVIRSFQEFDLCAEPYMKEEGTRMYYFGDLDYEGIGIYENLAGMFRPVKEIRPFLPAYETMIEKAGGADRLPETKERQNRHISGLFYSYFSEPYVRRMKEILEAQKYIPQEILNIQDF